MNKNFRRTAFALGLCSVVGLGYAPQAFAGQTASLAEQAQQTKKVSGTISDDQGPVAGASVMEKGTSNGTITDVNGRYSLNVKPGATLVVSYMGYVTQEVKIGSRAVINVSLEEDNKILDEVVVVGYGTMKKKLVTGATIQVKGDDVAALNTSNALGALASMTPGVMIMQASAQPGKGYKVNIRGAGTISDAEPLIVIDGVVGGAIDDVNPNDIESIDVLKDAASAAIYGSRAANGVILITTKQGKAGKVELTYNGSVGWSNVYKRPQLLNAQQYMTIMDEYMFNTSGNKMDWAGYVPQNVLDKVAGGWEGTDWWEQFTNKNAVQNSHSVSLNGGTDRSKFVLSYGYNGNEGIMGADQASYYNRHTIRMNSDHVLLKAKDFDVITIGENLYLGYNKSHDLAEDGMYWSYIHSLLQTSPLVPVYANEIDPTAEPGALYNHKNYGAGWNDYYFSNPYENLSKGGFNSMAESRNINARVSGFITIQPIKGLRWRSQLNYMWRNGAYRNFGIPRSPSAGSGTVESYSVSQNAWLNSRYSFENTITYDLPSFNGHKISAMVGQSYDVIAWSANVGGSNKVAAGEQLATLKDWNSAYLNNIKLVSATDASLSGNPNDENYLASWFGRVSYDYKEKYMATATLRADGSSTFAKGHRWGIFPSVSAGWTISQEDFMESTKSWMDFLKIRASWGQNGNNRIPGYQYIATIAQSGGANDNGYKFDSSMESSTSGIPHSGAFADKVPTPELKWETSEQLDFGIDARFLGSRLGLTFDWYKKTTRDWLLSPAQGLLPGLPIAYKNGGEAVNKGVELALSWNDKVGKDLRYNASVNLAYNKNEVTRIDNFQGYENGQGSILSQGTEYIYRLAEGKPMGYFYGMSYSGIWQSQEQIEAARAAGKAVLDDAQPGDCIWDDFNGDGVITWADNDKTDRHEIGNPIPDVTLGINLGIQYKGFDFSLNGVGAFGHQIMRSYRSYADSPQHNYDTSILDRWHGAGTSNEMPRLSGTGHPNTLWVSTRYMENANYFKIKALTLGYDFKNVWKSCPFQQLRLYFQAQNLCTITSYTGLDPEVGSAGGAQSWASGIDLGLYPSARTYLIGASIKF